MKQAILIYLVAFALFAGFGCTPTTPGEVTPTPSPTPSARIALSWEGKTGGKGTKVPAAWSEIIVTEVGKNFSSFEKGSDWAEFCPKFKSLDKTGKTRAMGEFVVAVILHESSYEPTSWMTETTMGIDPVTGKQVKSEGHLQLSYQDKQWAPWCAFDWSKDKLLSQNDPKKTIFKPEVNLPCGIRIMGNQIAKKGKLAPGANYWAVLNPNGKYSKVPDLKARTKKASGCQ